MGSKKNNTGGNTQSIDGDKPKKPKPAAVMTLTVMDNGQIAGDFWVYDDDEIGRRKKWTVSGDEFIKYVNRTQPNNVRVLASTINVQIVTAGLSEDMQGPWLRRNDKGELEISQGNYLVTGHAPGGKGLADRAADRQEVAAAKAIGLSPTDTAAALPNNAQARALPPPTPLTK